MRVNVDEDQDKVEVIEDDGGCKEERDDQVAAVYQGNSEVFDV